MPDETKKPPATNLTRDELHDQSSTQHTEFQATPTVDDLLPPQQQQNTSNSIPKPEGQAPAPQPDPGAEDAPEAISPRVAELKYGTGVEGEVNVWEARYSFKNFYGRIGLLALLSVTWIVFALFIFADNAFGPNARPLLWFAGIVLVLSWLWLGWSIIRHRYGRYYRLTNRRLFISNGLFYRERDQVELLTVNDVHTVMPSIIHRWLDYGDVIVSSREDQTSTSYVIGINHPKDVQDLIWHYARADRERRAVQVDQV